MRRAHRVLQPQQRVAGEDGFALEHVDGREARPAAVERGDERRLLQQLGPRGVDEQRRGLHLQQVVELDQVARGLRQAQVHAQHVGAGEELLARGHGAVAVGRRALARLLRAPHRHLHAEGLAVAGHQLADAAVAPDAERLAAQRHAHAEVGRHGRGLQARLLPRAVLEVGDVLRQAAHRGHDQRPRELGRRVGRAHALGHGDAVRRAGIDVDVLAHLARLCDQAQLGQLLEQLAREARAFADQHQHFGVAQAHRQLADALDGVGEHLRVQVAELGGAGELPHRVLVIVEDDDVHASDYGPRNEPFRVGGGRKKAARRRLVRWTQRGVSCAGRTAR